jgi:hypothetical protein
MNSRKFLAVIAIFALLLSTSLASAAERVGRVSASFGKPTINGKPITLATPVENGDQIATGPTDAAALLLDSKVVVKIEGDTVLRVVEEQGKTDIKIDRGTVQVFVAKRAANQGPVALTDPDATMEAIGTIFAASYAPATREGRYAALESFIDVKGNADPNATHVNVNNEAVLRNGKLVGVGPIDREALRRRTGNINQMNLNAARQSGAQFWRRAAARDALNLIQVATGPARPGEHAADAIALTDALNDARQFHSIQVLSSAGILNTGGTGGGGSSGGFGDVVVQLDPGSLLNFSVLDSGVEDGDHVRLKITSGGKTVLDRTVNMTNAGETFSQKVTPGKVRLSVTALNEGSLPPNTGEVNVTSAVISGDNQQLFDLNKGETGVLRIDARKEVSQLPLSAARRR